MRSGSPWLLGLFYAALTSASSLEGRDGLAVLEIPYARGRVSHIADGRCSKRDSVLDVHAKVEDHSFYTNITFGTPPQELTVIFTTVNSECWLQGVESSDCGLWSNASLCGGDGGYNRTASSSAKLINHSFFINDTGASVTGETVTDILKIGNATIPSMKMGVAESGITMNTIGLGYGNSSSVSLTQALADGGVIKSPAFSLYNSYSKYYSPFSSSPGRILFGGVKKAMYNGTLYTFPIVDSPTGHPKAFRINMTGISLNDTTISSNSFPVDAIFDIYTELTYIPTAAAKDLFAQLGVTKMPAEHGQITLPCSLRESNATISLKFGNAVFQFPLYGFLSTDSPYSGSIETDDVNDCYFDIAANYNYQQEGSIVIGAKFLEYIYAVFDLGNDQVSLAHRTFEAMDDDIVEIGSGKDAVPGSTLQESNGETGISASSGSSGTNNKDGKKSAATHVDGGIRAPIILTVLTAWFLLN